MCTAAAAAASSRSSGDDVCGPPGPLHGEPGSRLGLELELGSGERWLALLHALQTTPSDSE
jgi:hypothetical protein